MPLTMTSKERMLIAMTQRAAGHGAGGAGHLEHDPLPPDRQALLGHLPLPGPAAVGGVHPTPPSTSASTAGSRPCRWSSTTSGRRREAGPQWQRGHRPAHAGAHLHPAPRDDRRQRQLDRGPARSTTSPTRRPGRAAASKVGLPEARRRVGGRRAADQLRGREAL